MGHYNVAVFTQQEGKEIVNALLEPYSVEILGKSAYDWDYNLNAKYDWYSVMFDFTDVGCFDDVSCAVLPTGEWIDLSGKSEERKNEREKIKKMAIKNGWHMAVVDCHC